MLKVREKVTLIDCSLAKIDDNITNSTQSVIELKEKFQNVLESMQILKLVKSCFTYLEKAEIFVERGSLPQRQE